MFLELTSLDGIFIVYGVYYSSKLVLSPDVNIQVLYHENKALELVKTSVRHNYCLWACPPPATTLLLDHVDKVVAGNQEIQFQNNFSQVEGWIHSINGAVKLCIKMSDSDPRWHGLPVLEDDKLLGIIHYRHHLCAPLITPIDIISLSKEGGYMDPDVSLDYRDEQTSWYNSKLCNAHFRYCDFQIEQGKSCTLVLENDQNLVVSVIHYSPSIKYSFTPLIEWNENVYVENEHGHMVCIYRSSNFEVEQVVIPKHAWITMINDKEVTSFNQMQQYVLHEHAMHAIICWSNGMRETFQVNPENQTFVVWALWARKNNKEDPCYIE